MSRTDLRHIQMSHFTTTSRSRTSHGIVIITTTNATPSIWTHYIIWHTATTHPADWRLDLETKIVESCIYNSDRRKTWEKISGRLAASDQRPLVVPYILRIGASCRYSSQSTKFIITRISFTLLYHSSFIDTRRVVEQQPPHQKRRHQHVNMNEQEWREAN